jgi:hypothetical protein
MCTFNICFRPPWLSHSIQLATCSPNFRLLDVMKSITSSIKTYPIHAQKRTRILSIYLGSNCVSWHNAQILILHQARSRSMRLLTFLSVISQSCMCAIFLNFHLPMTCTYSWTTHCKRDVKVGHRCMQANLVSTGKPVM